MNNEMEIFNEAWASMQEQAAEEVERLDLHSEVSFEHAEQGLKQARLNLAQEELQQELHYLSQRPQMKPWLPMVFCYENAERDKRIKLSTNTYRKSIGEGLEDYNGEEVTNFEICDLCLMIRYEDTELQEYRFKIRLSTGETRQLRMSVEEFRTGHWVDDIHGAVCRKRELFREYCRDCCGVAALPKHYETRTVGWIKALDGDRQFFITDTGEITGDLPDVLPINEGAQIVPSTHWSEREVAAKFLEMKNLTKSATALVLMVYTVLASLYSIFKEAVEAPKFLVALIGEPSAGKTSLAMAVANLYQREQRTEPQNSLRSTITSIEENLMSYKDSVMIVDDLFPASDRSQQRMLENTSEKVVRMFGDAVSKKRSKGFENYETEGMAILTGEYMTGATSSLSRCIILELKKGDLNFALLTRYQQDEKMVPAYFLWNFLRFCSTENVQQTMRAWIRENVEKKRQQYKSKFSRSRTANVAAYMSTAMEILAEYFHTAGTLSTAAQEAMCQDFDNKFCEILMANEFYIEEQTPAALVLRSLNRLFDEDDLYVADVEKAQEGADYYAYREVVYVHRGTLISDIHKKIAEMRSSLEIGEGKIKDILLSENILLPASEGNSRRYSVKLPFARRVKDSRRFWKLSRKRLTEISNDLKE